MVNNDALQNFLSELKDIRSYAGKIRHANENLIRIGSGSGRIVYDIDGTKVLKLARNPKGVAQNEAEANIGYYDDIKYVVTQVFDNADNNEWIISEKAKKVTDKRIRELTDIPTLNDLYHFLKNYEAQSKGQRRIFGQDKEMENFFWENEFAYDLGSFIANYSQNAGDMGRPSTYGEVLRDGHPTIVLTDYGLNDEVYDTHYSPERKGQRMYELYNYADGNDDILSDIGDTGEVRHRMWGLIPYTMADAYGGFEDISGEDIVTEEFVNFVENRNSYPSHSISNISYLTENFYEAIGNIKNIKTKNKKHFYENLLKLQDYLIQQNQYDKDQLLSEEIEIPKVSKFQEISKEYGQQLALSVTEKLGLGKPQLLGGGGFGHAFLVDGKVLKITNDASEVDSGYKIMIKKPKHLAEVYKIYKLVDTEQNLAFYVLLEEYLPNTPAERFGQYSDLMHQIIDKDMLMYIAPKERKSFNYDEKFNEAQLLLTNKPELNIDEKTRQEVYKFAVGLLNIEKDLLDNNIKSYDYVVEPKNMGYDNNNTLKFFDVGGYSVRKNPPEVPKDSTIFLPENELNEEYDKDIADKIANNVAEKLGLTQPQHIGNGHWGVAYDIGNNKILKITKDRSEATENSQLIGKQLKYLAQPYKVFDVQSKTMENNHKTYAIILEKLIVDSSIEKSFNRIEYIFKNLLKIQLWKIMEDRLGMDDNEDEIDSDKIEAYMRKNPNDAKFYNGLLNIADELRQYNIHTIDFLKSENLGYKQNGDLGFFDVGYTHNSNTKSNNAVAMNIAEFGGTALRSKTNTIGSDGFPTYNQNDTSPLTDNNIPRNNFAEDLEYNHVDDATKDIYKLTERIMSAMKGSSTVDVKKKCKLGGLGNTSAACNQGDISNLDIKPIDEDFILSANDYKNYDEKSATREFQKMKNVVDHHVETKEYFTDEEVMDLYHNLMVMNYNPALTREILGYDDTDKYFSFIKKTLQSRGKIKIRGQANEWSGNGNLTNNDAFYQTAGKYIGELDEVILAEIEKFNEADIMSLNDLPFKEQIESIGGKIYSVGGAVRDEFLGKESKDLDIMITGIPFDELEGILGNYGKVNAVGKSFGVLKFVPTGETEEIDVAIPRTETATGDGGHKDFAVVSDHTMPVEKDLERRDFTINAIAKDVNGNIIDPYGGQKDLQAKIIRMVNPKAFAEDPLRMLRATQFASRFGFKIEPNTMRQIRNNANKIKEIPAERFLIEFDKIVKKGNARYGAQLLKDTGLFNQLFGFDINQQVIDRSPFESVKTMGEFIYLLLQSIQNPAEYYKNTLKGDLKSYNEIVALQLGMTDTLNNNVQPVKARLIASEMFKKSPEALQSNILPQVIKVAANDLLSGKYPKGVNELQVNGNDLMQLGLKGQEIGDTGRKLLLFVYNDKVRNNKEELLSIVSNNKLTEVKKKNIAYTAVVLDDKSRKDLLDMFDRVIPEGWKIEADHMTIKLGELDSKEDLGKKVELFVRDYAVNDKVTAVGVSGYDSDNEKRHITLAVNTAAGGTPKDSKLLTGWRRIGFKLKLTGRIEEVESALTQLNEGKSKHIKEKEALMRSKSISKEMKEEILKYFGGGSTYKEGGRVHGLSKPKEFTSKSPKTQRISLGADKDGFYCYTHRAASKRYDSPGKISVKDINFIESTG